MRTHRLTPNGDGSYSVAVENDPIERAEEAEVLEWIEGLAPQDFEALLAVVGGRRGDAKYPTSTSLASQRGVSPISLRRRGNALLAKLQSEFAKPPSS